MRLGLGFGLAVLVLAGCEPGDLTTCDPMVARTLVFDSSGNPAYAGQAQVQMECTGCHGSEVIGAGRRGAPAGLDFDMVGSRTADPNSPNQAAVDALVQGRTQIRDIKGEMLATVEGETMPPGEIGAAAFADAGFTYADGTTVERLNTPEGLEVYRNWLACGSPVVERTGDPPSTCGSTTGEAFDCAIRGAGLEPVEPNWNAIFDSIIRPKCATSGCHLEATDTNGMLALADRDAARTNLIDQAPRVAGCTDRPSLIIPSDANGSYLTEKLTGMASDGSAACGLRMPIGPTPLDNRREIEPIREWINAGALP